MANGGSEDIQPSQRREDVVRDEIVFYGSTVRGCGRLSEIFGDT